MGLKTVFIKQFAKKTAAKVNLMASRPHESQKEVFESLIRKGQKTAFGRDHEFQGIESYKDFKTLVPVRDYEGLKGYVNRIIDGESSVLWPGKPKYFAKTSGTTSGIKYIPITQDSMPNHIDTARNTLFSYVAETSNAFIFGGKMIFLSGSPELSMTSGIHTGRLSGIVNHELPFYVKSNRLPSEETNMIEDCEKCSAVFFKEVSTS